MTATCSEYGGILFWDNECFVLDEGDGTYGAMAFGKGVLVASFFDAHSKHNPIGRKDNYEIGRFFEGMPESHRSLVNVALTYNKQNYHGEPTPLVTAAFWDEGKYLAASFSWTETLRDGARILRLDLIENFDRAIDEWREAYEMSSNQVSFVRRLYIRRLAEPLSDLVLEPSESEWLRSISENSESFKYSCEMFQGIGIILARQ
jgi:hypothetical protein